MDILIRNLKKYYDARLVLDIEQVEFFGGRITGVLGANGAGKSTLLNIIAGLENGFSGDIKYDYCNIDKKVHNQMTIVFQRPFLFKTSVFKNLEYPLKIRNISCEKRKEMVEEMLSRLGISDLRDKKAHALSGGEAQKVAFARAIIFKPGILLLDEPVSNVDSDSTERIEKEIKNYCTETGALVIFITHSLKQAKRVCDDIIYLDKGRLVKSDEFF